MNLLPRPRTIELGDELAPNRLPRERIDRALRAEGYELHIGPDEIDLVAGDEAGLFYGKATLGQLARIHHGRVPVGRIRDWPDLAVRGVMIDVSRDKVPTMQTVRDLVDRLASWKVNQVQLYSEHTFAYARHPEVHESASPFTADEIRDLDAFCRDRHVELVPNQNCLGHMDRWLRHERYRALAIRPEGFVDQFGFQRQPTSIDPSNPDSLALVRQLLDELLPLFSSRRVHLGLDEVWELPEDRLDEFVAWVGRLRDLPELAEHEILMWGDMVAGSRAQIARLPEGVTVCEWGYEAAHPFDQHTALLAEAGVPSWVSPGTSSWLSIVGRVTNARENIRQAARAALSRGAVGLLNTDWGDEGHLQQLPVSDPGLAYGAAVSWCLAANEDVDLAAALSTHCYDDESGELATAVLQLGDAHLSVAPQLPNMSTIVLHLYYPQLQLGRGPTRGIARDQLERLEGVLSDALTRVGRATPRRIDRSLLEDEVRWGGELVELLTRDAIGRLDGDGTVGAIPSAQRDDLRTRLGELIETYRTLWLRRNRPGGLDDSVSVLGRLDAAYSA